MVNTLRLSAAAAALAGVAVAFIALDADGRTVLTADV